MQGGNAALVDKFAQLTMEEMEQEERQREKDRALFHAVYNHDVKAVRQAIQSGACVNSLHSGMSLVFWYFNRSNYAKKLNTEVLALLIASNADVTRLGEDGFTPLHLAALYGHEDGIRLLVASKADVNAPRRDAGGKTPLWQAVFGYEQNAAALLIALGAEVPSGVNRLLKIRDGMKKALIKALLKSLVIEPFVIESLSDIVVSYYDCDAPDVE